MEELDQGRLALLELRMLAKDNVIVNTGFTVLSVIVSKVKADGNETLVDFVQNSLNDPQGIFTLYDDGSIGLDPYDSILVIDHNNDGLVSRLNNDSDFNQLFNDAEKAKKLYHKLID